MHTHHPIEEIYSRKTLAQMAKRRLNNEKPVREDYYYLYYNQF